MYHIHQSISLLKLTALLTNTIWVDDEECRKLAAARGLEVVSLRESWASHVERGWLHRALVWEGQGDGEAQVARQLAVARREPHRPRTLHLTPGRAVVLVEWRGGSGSPVQGWSQARIYVWLCLS